MWITIAKVAFSILITAVGKISPEEWAKLGTVIQSWLQAIQDKLPAGHPLITMASAYKAPRSKLARFRPDDAD